MKALLPITCLFLSPASPVRAHQDDLQIAIAQTASPRRLVAGDERSQVFVLISNRSEKPQRVWQARNAWGAQTIRLELTDREGRKLGHIINGQQMWTMNAPNFDTIVPGDTQVFPISIRHPGVWELRGERLKSLAKDAWHQVRIRAIFNSKDFDQKGVWTGQAESPFYDFELRIRPDQPIGQAPPLANPGPPPQIADVKQIPDGTYSVRLEWWEKEQTLTVVIRDSQAQVIESSDPLLADMTAKFQRADDGTFGIFFQTKDGQGASQYWIPQEDGSFIIKEVPDRGEQQRAVPLPKSL